MGAHLPLRGLESVDGEPLMPLTRGSDAKPIVTIRMRFTKFSNALIIIIISIRTKNTNTEKQLTQQYRLYLSAEKEPSAKRKKRKNEKTTRTVPLTGGHSDRLCLKQHH